MEIWSYDKDEVKMTPGCSVSIPSNKLNFKILFIYFVRAQTCTTVAVRVQLV